MGTASATEPMYSFSLIERTGHGIGQAVFRFVGGRRDGTKKASPRDGASVVVLVEPVVGPSMIS